MVQAAKQAERDRNIADRSKFILPAIPVTLEGRNFVSLVQTIPIGPFFLSHKEKVDIFYGVILPAFARIDLAEKVELELVNSRGSWPWILQYLKNR